MDPYAKYRNKHNHIAIPISALDCIEVFHGGLGICDWCSKPKPHGYLCPVLGTKWSCDDCYKEWVDSPSTQYYESDKEYEEKVAARMITAIKMFKPEAL